jgi:predicted porin
MKKVNILFLIAIGIFSLTKATAQDKSVSPDSIQMNFKPYGSFRGHYAFYNKEVEFQENGSRIGFEYSVKRKNVRYIVHSELKLNMFKSDATFNADASVSGGFLVPEKNQERQVFATRLGFLGVDLQKYGIITVGKQWGVYYDVTSYTDKMNVFGGRGSATYVAGTDGGATGTGRADQALVYRNTIGPLSLGAQVQARTAYNNHFFDGYGLSAQMKILTGLKAGVAYNKAYLNEEIINHILGLEGNPTYLSVGASYSGKKIDLGAVYANQTNGDLSQGLVNDPTDGISTPSVVFNANGFELYGKYKFDKINLIAGFNYYNPDVENIAMPNGQHPLSADFGRNDIILGIEYYPVQTAYFYAESRISSGKTALGLDETNVLTLGVRINVERTLSKTFKL